MPIRLIAFFLLLSCLSALPAVDAERFVWADINLALRLPSGWLKAPQADASVRLTALKNGNALLVSATIADVTAEEGLANMILHTRTVAQVQGEPVRSQPQVAGETAEMAELQYREQGVLRRGFFVTFAHQGVIYTVIAVHNRGDRVALLADLRALLKSVSFPGQRAEWLARLGGDAVDISLAGGFVRFPLIQPRWRETTFDDNQAANGGDLARFALSGGGAFLYATVAETTQDEAAEREMLRVHWEGLLVGGKSTDRSLQAPGREIAYGEVTGSYSEVERRVWIWATVTEGVVLRVVLEAHAAKSSEVFVDWRAVLEQTAFAAKAQGSDGPVFPMTAPTSGAVRDDPAIAALVAGGERMWSDGDAIALAVSPDGDEILCLGDQLYLEAVATRRRRPIDVQLQRWPVPRVSWSQDGARIAFSADDGIVVVTRATLAVARLPIAVGEVAFAGDRLIAAMPIGGDQRQGQAPVTSRLVEIDPDSEATRTLCEVPLGRFALLTPGPETVLAVACNRDGRRTDAYAANVMLADTRTLTAAADLRSLTTGVEQILALAWMPDGTLLAVRRQADPGAATMRHSWFEGGDLWRLDAKSPSAQRLTAIGGIERVWPLSRGRIAIDLTGWRIPAAQRGVYALSVDRLAPLPASAASAASSQAGMSARITTAVLAAAGTATAATVVPTAAMLERIADAFATSVAAHAGEQLDFSAASLDRLGALSTRLSADPGGSYDALVLGLGAYYGETLRRCAGATWRIAPQAFGTWLPVASDLQSNALVQAVFPFDEIAALALSSEAIAPLTDGFQRNLGGRSLALVYPPQHGPEALRAATDPAYLAAWERAAAGDVAAAIDALVALHQRMPDARALAAELISLCEAADRAEQAVGLREAAVASGDADPAVIEAQADQLIAEDPQQAIVLYRSLARQPWVRPQIYLKLGKAFAAAGQTSLALDSWRWAMHRHADQAELRTLVEAVMPKPAVVEAPAQVEARDGEAAVPEPVRARPVSAPVEEGPAEPTLP